MNLLFIPAGIVNLIILIAYFIYCKPAIVATKQLDLKTKSPVFSIFGETLAALSQIFTYKRRFSLLKIYSKAVNNSSMANLSFWMVSRGFGAYISFVTSFIMFIGVFIGIVYINP